MQSSKEFRIKSLESACGDVATFDTPIKKREWKSGEIGRDREKSNITVGGVQAGRVQK